MKRVLMVAYHFPPLAGSSGIQRTLRFVQHLPSLGWTPLVLTARPMAYERTSNDLEAEVPAGTVVRRAFALDTARHLSLFGRHVGAMATPDRWASWHFGAVRQGLKLAREFRPQAIWSTYPIATAHAIGAALQRRTGLPWIADFRDPMAQDGYPADPRTWQAYRRIEDLAMRHASACVFTTPGAARTYRARYPDAAERIAVLENGYDESSFENLEPRDPSPLHPGALTLLHSGIVYPAERDPTQLFEALGTLARAGRIDPGRLRLRFRAPVHETMLLDAAARHGVGSFVDVCPALPYREALAEMCRADALLVLQASNCNDQIPAKLYEYLRAGRPVLCLADPAGDTAEALRRAGIDSIARLDRASDIADVLPRFLQAVSSGCAQLPLPEAVRRASRREQARWLAERLDHVSSMPAQAGTRRAASFHGAA